MAVMNAANAGQFWDVGRPSRLPFCEGIAGGTPNADRISGMGILPMRDIPNMGKMPMPRFSAKLPVLGGTPAPLWLGFTAEDLPRLAGPRTGALSGGSPCVPGGTVPTAAGAGNGPANRNRPPSRSPRGFARFLRWGSPDSFLFTGLFVWEVLFEVHRVVEVAQDFQVGPGRSEQDEVPGVMDVGIAAPCPAVAEVVDK